ncbi:uncharacterized protein LOC101168094 [Oryzias latipes]|uniref:Si:ch211-113e8.11 n=1 Tax=Oryzias latipes TaxID=8090 RepID=A0A3B3HWR1_ORYLA|nr:uncharacterized protein LOC101168094 [Oryzias latipes]
MKSLVGYGVSSDSDSENETRDRTCDRLGSIKETGEKTTAGQEGRNFLLESELTSSESEPEYEDPEPSSPPHPKTAASVPREPTLPAPSFGSHNPNRLPPPPLKSSSDCSVFANPFKAQVDQKLIALQKHVPLTMQPKPSQIGGRKMCVSYRKDGRCRFGIKCKFAHDSDLQTVTASSSHDPPGREEPSGATQAPGQRSQNPRLEFKEEEEQPAKKKRVGLSNTLIPPKKAMKQFSLQRSREQINTS